MAYEQQNEALASGVGNVAEEFWLLLVVRCVRVEIVKHCGGERGGQRG